MFSDKKLSFKRLCVKVVNKGINISLFVVLYIQKIAQFPANKREMLRQTFIHVYNLVSPLLAHTVKSITFYPEASCILAEKLFNLHNVSCNLRKIETYRF